MRHHADGDVALSSDYLKRWDTGHRSPIHDRIRRHYRALRASQYWSGSEWEAYLLKRLKRLVSHAWNHAPLYRSHWGEMPEIQSLEDFARLPILERSVVSNNPDLLRATTLPPGVQVGAPTTTSGSTGQVVRVHADTESVAAAAAAEILAMEWEEVDPTLPAAYVRTYSSGPPETVAALSKGVRIPRWASGPLREMFPWGDAFLIDASTSPDWIAQFLDAAKPQRLIGYPTVLLMTTDHWKPGYALRSVRCYGENLHQADKERLEERLGTRVWNAWSANETGPIANECPDMPGRLHLHGYLHYVEVVREDGEPCEPGESGSVLITPLYSVATPLVRYRLGDQATLGECECERTLPALASMDGRTFSMFRLHDGRRMLASRVIDRLGKIPGLVRFQILQWEYRRFEMLLVTAEADYQAVSEQAERLLREFFADEGEISVECRRVEELPLAPSGKFEKVRWMGQRDPK